MGRLSRIKERFTDNSAQEVSGRQKMQGALVAGGASLLDDDFISDIYNQQEMTPHQEMKEVAKMERTNPYVYNRIQTEVDAILGRGIGFETDDPETRQFFESTVKPKMRDAVREQVEGYVKGNGYVEVIRDGNDVPINFKPIARPEQVYIDWGKGYEVKGYVLQMPRNLAEDSYTVPYTGRSTRQIHGVRFEEDEIIHAKNGISPLPPYGRSGLASAIDDHKINRELMRDKAVIAKFKLAAKKLIKVMRQDGTAASDDDVRDFKQQLQATSDFENLIYGDKMIETQDLGYDVGQMRLEEMMQSTEKAMAQGIPSFASHGDVTNYAVAKEEKNLWYLRIQAQRQDIKQVWQPVLREIARAKGLDPDVSLSFGAFDFPTREEEIQETLDLWEAGVIQLNEAREELGYEALDEDDIGDGFKFELTQDNPLEDAMQQKLEDMQGDDDEPSGQDSEESETA